MVFVRIIERVAKRRRQKLPRLVIGDEEPFASRTELSLNAEISSSPFRVLTLFLALRVFHAGVVVGIVLCLSRLSLGSWVPLSSGLAH